MTYLDTNSLLKLVWQERESEAFAELVGREALVLVSSLTELESRIQISAAHLAGAYSLSRARRLRSELDNLLKSEPFERRTLSGAVFETARTQQARHGSTAFCRTLARCIWRQWKSWALSAS
jgi:uncharacterized protein with PIN domain